MEPTKGTPQPPTRPRRRITYEEYASWPEDGRRYEILDGEAVELSAPTPDHQEVLANLYVSIREFLLKTGAGKAWISPIDVVPDPHWVVQPDVIAIRRENLGVVGRKAVTGAPDLLVEVLSPSTEARDRGVKRQLYERIGVRELWLVDLEERTLEQYAAEGGALRPVARHGAAARVDSRAFPGLAVELAWVWPEPPADAVPPR
jgi:Uma2 family endonuclease